MHCTTQFWRVAFFTLKIHFHDSWSIIMVSPFSPSLTDSRFIRSLGQWTCKNCIISWQKIRPRNVRKITTNTTNFTFYYLLIYWHEKTEQFDLPNICSRELCNELIWSHCTFTLSNFIIISSSLFVDCVLLGYAIKQWSLKYLETHFSNINLIPDRKRSSSVDLRHVPMDSPMRLTGALQN